MRFPASVALRTQFVAQIARCYPFRPPLLFANDFETHDRVNFPNSNILRGRRRVLGHGAAIAAGIPATVYGIVERLPRYGNDGVPLKGKFFAGSLERKLLIGPTEHFLSDV